MSRGVEILELLKLSSRSTLESPRLRVLPDFFFLLLEEVEKAGDAAALRVTCL